MRFWKTETDLTDLGNISYTHSHDKSNKSISVIFANVLYIWFVNYVFG